MPAAEPITTRVSPAASGSCGPGAASTSSVRTMATIEQPVSVRAFVLPSGCPAKGDPG